MSQKSPFRAFSIMISVNEVMLCVIATWVATKSTGDLRVFHLVLVALLLIYAALRVWSDRYRDKTYKLRERSLVNKMAQCKATEHCAKHDARILARWVVTCMDAPADVRRVAERVRDESLNGDDKPLPEVVEEKLS